METKKYKVVTDDLEWIGIKKGHVVNVKGGQLYGIRDIHPLTPLNCQLVWAIHNTDWFEEVKEKEWEVLEKESASKTAACHEPRILKIKRLSDGEIFTVGDYVIYPNKEGKKKIINLIIYDDNMCVQLEGGIGYALSGIEPYEKEYRWGAINNLEPNDKLFTKQNMIDFAIFHGAIEHYDFKEVFTTVEDNFMLWLKQINKKKEA